MRDKQVTMHTGSFTYKIYQYVIKKRAVTTSEIAEEFKKSNLKKNHVSSYLLQLLKNNLVVKSTERVQSKNRMCSRSFVYGLTVDDIRRKIEQMKKTVNKDDLLVGIKAKVYEILQNNATGLTLAEIFYSLKDYPSMEDYENWDYCYQSVRDLFVSNRVKRSSFMLPAKAMIHGKTRKYLFW